MRLRSIAAGYGGLTALEVWLIRLDISVTHGAAYHPQPQGTIERWHRTIGADVYWSNVPYRVWDYTLGGYQVLKKWLSYRETAVLGRRLHADEARTFTQIARRIAAIILLEASLDANYLRCATETWDWRAAVQRAEQPRLWTDG